MNKLLPFLLLSLYLCSCDSTDGLNAQQAQESFIEAIAKDPVYDQYRKALHGDQMALATHAYALDSISRFFEDKLQPGTDLCTFDLKSIKIRGIEHYQKNLCAIRDAYFNLLDKFPEFENISSEQRQKIANYYKRELGQAIEDDRKKLIPDFKH